MLVFSMTEQLADVDHSSTPPESSKRPQIGLAAMLVMVILAALVSAGLVYAARIPEIQEELSVLLGTEVTVDHTRRAPQILFILFTVTSPLLLAMFLSLVTTIWGAWTSRSSCR